MTEEIAQNAQAHYNTKRLRRWAFTWNNYEDCTIIYLKEILADSIYYLGYEIGGTTETKHIQGCVAFPHGKTFDAVRKLLKNNHIDPLRTINDWKRMTKYCMKDGNYETNDPKFVPPKNERLLKSIYSNIEWKEWQAHCLSILQDTPDTRTINWIVDRKGGIGKSFLCKYIVLKYDAVICSGKTNDINNQIRTWFDNHENEINMPITVVDVPRSEFSHVNYAAIESIKNGLLYSGKYEGGVVYGVPNHIFVFANFTPSWSQLSADRWRVVEIIEGEMIKIDPRVSILEIGD